MTKFRTISVLLLVAALALPGCLVRARGGVYAPAPAAVVVVEEEPPPPRVFYAAPRAGHIYVDGRWHRHGNRWVWRDGHYVRARAGHVWAPGRWQRRGRGHVWVEGGWRTGGRGKVRVQNHRDNRGGGVKVRDHRR